MRCKVQGQNRMRLEQGALQCDTRYKVEIEQGKNKAICNVVRGTRSK
jgi:hypothetical protein